MAKIERKYMAHFIDASFGGENEAWWRLGKDLEEFNVELNPDTETSKNIIGESTFKHNGYEVSAEADPYYANDEDEIFEKLQQIVDERLTGDGCKTKALEVHLWKGNETSGFEAYRQECYVIPNSYGGDTSGYQIPFSVYYTGTREKGTYNSATKKFTVGTEVATVAEETTES